MNEFSITTAASKRIAFLLSKRDNPQTKLRVSIEGGGCSGFQYRYDFVNDDVAADDLYIEQNGAKIVIDNTSLELVNGAVLDFVEDLNGAYFQMKNPNAASGCGCGNSFSV